MLGSTYFVYGIMQVTKKGNYYSTTCVAQIWFKYVSSLEVLTSGPVIISFSEE